MTQLGVALGSRYTKSRRPCRIRVQRPGKPPDTKFELLPTIIARVINLNILAMSVNRTRNEHCAVPHTEVDRLFGTMPVLRKSPSVRAHAESKS